MRYVFSLFALLCAGMMGPAVGAGMPSSPHFTNMTRGWSSPKAKTGDEGQAGARNTGVSNMRLPRKAKTCVHVLGYTAELLKSNAQDKNNLKRVQALEAWARQWEATLPTRMPESVSEVLEEKARGLVERRDREALTTCLAPPLRSKPI